MHVDSLVYLDEREKGQRMATLAGLPCQVNANEMIQAVNHLQLNVTPT